MRFIFILYVLFSIFIFTGCHVHHIHPNGIGYYREEKNQKILTDLDTSAPFTVLADTVTDDIKNQSVFVRFSQGGNLHVYFSMNGRDYIRTISPAELFKTPFFTIKIILKDSDYDESGDKNTYCFKFDR